MQAASLIKAKGGRAKPIMVGAWHTTREYSVVHRSVKIEKGTEVQRIPAGIVDIVETRYLERDGHIRGRLASGGWMSLVNVKENVGYAKQVEKRRSVWLVHLRWIPGTIPDLSRIPKKSRIQILECNYLSLLFLLRLLPIGLLQSPKMILSSPCQLL